MVADVFGVLASGDLPALVLAAALGLVVAALAGWPVRTLARRLGAVAFPGGRHVHRTPTPRLGGVAVLSGVVAGTLGGLCLAATGNDELWERVPHLGAILGIAVLVCLLGMRDDIRPLSPTRKLLGLTIAGVLLVASGVDIDVLDVPGLGRVALGPLGAIGVVLWVLACANAVNLIDGVDGLGAGVVVVACSALALLAHVMGDTTSAIALLAIDGACIGFLLHNREPARLFLGDSGSLLLGYLLAALSAEGSTKRATATFLVAALLALAVPFLDTAQAFVRRFRRARRTLGPGKLLQRIRATAIGDAEHLHHRLLRRGLSHRQVAMRICLCALVPGGSALLLVPTGNVGLPTLLGAALASGLVLWRMSALPSAFRPTPPPVEKDVVLPRGTPRPARETKKESRPHELV